jgi:chromosome segregation ATPase
MKTLRQLSVIPVTILLLAGCKTGNYEKGADTASGLTESGNRIAAGNAKIDATLAALNDLVNNPQTDAVPKFKKYSSALSDLESAGKDVSAKVTSMRESGNEYFKAWDQQLAAIKNEDIKSRSAERRAEIQQKFTEIKKNYVEAGDAFKPFMSDLKDIQTALGTDLSAGGIASVKGAADKANKDAVPLKETINKLSAQFKDLGVALASAPQPAAPAK